MALHFVLLFSHLFFIPHDISLLIGLLSFFHCFFHCCLFDCFLILYFLVLYLFNDLWNWLNDFGTDDWLCAFCRFHWLLDIRLRCCISTNENQILVFFAFLHFLLPHLLQEGFRVCRGFGSCFSCNVRHQGFFLDNLRPCCRGGRVFLEGRSNVSVQEVRRGVLTELILNVFVTLHVVIDIKDMGELHAVVHFDPLVSEVVEVEAAKDDVEKLGHLEEAHAPLGDNLLLALLAEVEIVRVKDFGLHVPLKGEF